MKTTIKVLRNVAAIVLLILGIVGIVVPVMPQILFLVGAFMVADFERKHVFMRWLLSRRRTRKLLGAKLTDKLLSLDPARRKRIAAVDGGTNPPAQDHSSTPSATLPASDSERKA